MAAARSVLSVLVLVLALVLAGCGDDDGEADPTPAGIGDEDVDATVPDDDDGAVGEDAVDRPGDDGDAEDSQTDTTTAGSSDDVVPESNRALINGDFAGGDIRLLLTVDSACAIREPGSAGGEAAAEVGGSTEDGDRFSLDWSTDAGTLSSEVVLDGVTWTAEVDLDESDQHVVRLTRGEVLLETTYTSSDGQTAEAFLYVNCQPESVG